VSNMAAAGRNNVVIRLSKNTIVRRYAPDSVKFDDAKPGTISEIKPGDQVRARGTRNPEGTELAAEELISGSFRNIAGTVNTADPAKNTISVTDLTTKKPVSLQISSDSQLRQLPPMVAQRMAMRLHSASQPGVPAVPAAAAAGGPPRLGGPVPGGPPNGARPGPPADFQQMLSRMPEASLSTLHKGDAVMIVATQGSADSQPTVITLLTGVEPILTAAPDASGAAMLLSPWNLGAGMADAMTQ
jgi:hypothetical protein